MRVAAFAFVLVAIAHIAFAEPVPPVVHADPAPRLVLADADPELRRAVETALAPWHAVIVAEAKPPVDTAAANKRGAAAHARFVVWRDRAELVVYDSGDGSQQRRPVRDGKLDPVAAAAAALTVKTMLRLPPIEVVAQQPPPPPRLQRPVPAERGVELDAWVAAGGRLARGGDTDTMGAFSAAILVRPWSDIGLGVGVAVEIDGGADIDQGGFKGRWTEAAVTAIAAVRIGVGVIELEPWIGAGVIRSGLSGDEGGVARDESDLMFAIRGGAWGWWRWGRWSLGGGIAVDDAFGTPTYTKLGQARAVVFEVPSLGLVAGVAAGISFDL